MQDILTYIIIIIACIYAARRIYVILTQNKCKGCSKCMICNKEQAVKEK